MSRDTIFVVIISVFLIAGLLWFLVHSGAEDRDVGETEKEQVEEQRAADSDEERSEQERQADSHQADTKPAAEPDESWDDGAEKLVEEPDWKNLGDVEAWIEDLKAAHEAGDPNAAYYLFQMAVKCIQADQVLDDFREQRDEESSPEQRASIQERIDELSAMKGPCQDSRYEDLPLAISEQIEWIWHSAEAGHEDAMYKTVFGTYGGGSAPPGSDVPDEEDRDALRREFAEQLRESCHADSLHSMGVHMSRGSDVTRGLELGEFRDMDEETAQQAEAFAHRYAAASLREEGRPAEDARKSDHLLTAAEEAQAIALAEEIMEGC